MKGKYHKLVVGMEWSKAHGALQFLCWHNIWVYSITKVALNQLEAISVPGWIRIKKVATRAGGIILDEIKILQDLNILRFQ